MADKSAGKADGADNIGQSGTDQFPTYQDEKGLKAADKDAVGTVDSATPSDDLDPIVELNHGEESPAAKAEREEMEKNPPSPTPVQMLPENQDETVAPKSK